MPVTLDETPPRVDLKLYSQDDFKRYFIFVTVAPPLPRSKFKGPYDSGIAYAVNEIVESVDLLYVSLVASTNLTPASNPAAWFYLPKLDLTDWVNFQATIHGGDTNNDFTVDTTLQSSSVISLAMAKSTIQGRIGQGTQHWGFAAQTPEGLDHTFYAGLVSIQDGFAP